jgi:hypothetical protein
MSNEHLYWRIYSTVEAGSENYISLANIEFRSVAGISQQATGGAAISSGDYNSNYSKDNAFDANFTTTWISSNILPNYIGYQFSSTVSCAAIEITNRYDGYYYQAPSSFQLQYSDNGIDWEIAKSFSGITWDTIKQSSQLFNITGNYRELRIDQSYVFGSVKGDTDLGIDQSYVFGSVKGDTDLGIDQSYVFVSTRNELRIDQTFVLGSVKGKPELTLDQFYLFVAVKVEPITVGNFLILEKEQNDNKSFKISCANYDNRLYRNDHYFATYEY